MNEFLLALLVILLWGFWGFFSKIFAMRVGWAPALAWIYIMSSVFAIIFLFQKLSFKLDLVNGVVLFLGALSTTLAGIIFYKLLTVQASGVVVALTSLYPLVTIILGYLFLHEGLTIKQGVGIIFALVGMFLLGV
jgi:bacterial/archaeal transporter family protein